ncbi:hypothetical protein SORBI_3006G100200 [Sorghum bicolor]|uniref:RING-type E3 ubiquitin transferase n=1 Tax=Sorghum bicolor TaxID=4558 RepID=A0A1Z5RD43_SORBI|nr:hypothetical protein SORBI_3006G100200 [Sorghum bicolor]
MRPHRRALFPGAGDCEDPWSAGCQTPPPVPSSLDYGPGPSPSLPPFAGIPLCPPLLQPSPAPAHNGRRDQGGGMQQGYGPPPPGVGGDADDHARRHFVKYALIAAGVIAFVSLILLGVSVAVRRRQVRRRRQALLAPSLNAGGAANVDDGGGEWGGGGGGGGGGGVVHHVWNIRTVGLDEASISSIAVTRYRAGAGLLGAADCSVCLGEFQDGELCAHAFHVPCIDTWLRAHVNCPICRSDVVDPAVTAAVPGGGGGSESVGSSSSPPPGDPDANANAAADQVAAASDAASDHEGEESDGRDASPAEDDQQEQPSSAEPPPELLCPLPRNVRRAASMDAAADVAELDRLPEEAPEEEQIGGRRKRWTGTGPTRAKASGSGHRSNLSTDRLAAPSGVPRSFFSRHCRARSSVLPL